MKTLLLDDNQISRALLEQYIVQDSPELEIIGQAGDLGEARAFFRHQHPDLVLLDIQFPDGTAFELLEELHSQNRLDFDLIFITAFDTLEFMIRALDYSALNYLMKPLNRQDFRQAVEKALERRSDRSTLPGQVRMLLSQARGSDRQPEAIAIPLHNGSTKIVEVRDILYFEAYFKGLFTRVHLLSQDKSFVSNRPLGYFIDLLENDASFLRIHSGYLVNLQSVKHFDYAQRTVTLRNGTVLGIGRRRFRLVRERLLNATSAPEPKPGFWQRLLRLFRK